MTKIPRHWHALLLSAALALTITPSIGAESNANPSSAARASAKKKSVQPRPVVRKAVRVQRVVKRLPASRVRVQAQPVSAKMVVPQLSMGELAGLRATPDQLDLKSSVALVVDQETNEVLFSKNSQAVLPIASITKLMTAVVVTDAALPLTEVLTVTQDDVDTEKGSRSRLNVGTQLTRGEMLHLALMSSENRAAHALGRNYPGGLSAFVAAMNAKAQTLGMTDTRYVEPTGLSSQNRSSAHDLATLVKSAHASYPLIRELSTSPEYQVDVGHRQLQFHNTNGLVSNPRWEIGLQKTGYISEAGRCLVMQASMAGRKLIMVFLDSSGRYTRIADAERVRKWVTTKFAKSSS